MPPVQSVSTCGLGFCARGSGWLVLIIQSALPAVSAWALSNNTVNRVAGAVLAGRSSGALWATAPTGAEANSAATRPTTSKAPRRARGRPLEAALRRCDFDMLLDFS